jgi:hypothetical protein
MNILLYINSFIILTQSKTHNLSKEKYIVLNVIRSKEQIK